MGGSVNEKTPPVRAGPNGLQFEVLKGSGSCFLLTRSSFSFPSQSDAGTFQILRNLLIGYSDSWGSLGS